MLLPLSLLKYLLVHKFLIGGDLGFSGSVPILHHHHHQQQQQQQQHSGQQNDNNNSSSSKNTDNLNSNESDQKQSSTSVVLVHQSNQSKLLMRELTNATLTSLSASEKPKLLFSLLQPLKSLRKPSSSRKVQPRQNFWAIPYGALVALNAIAAVITFFLIGLDIAAMISVSIAVPVGIGYIILIIIRIIKWILGIVFRLLFTGGSVVTYGGLHSLLNGRIRDHLLYWASFIQHRLREKGLKKERLLVYQLLSQRGELWEDFLALSFEDVQFSMADKKLAHMQKEADRLERYLSLVRSRLNSEKWQRTRCRLENNCDD